MIKRCGNIVRVSPKHFFDGGNSVLIGGEFVLHLHLMIGETSDFSLPLPVEHLANTVQKRHHDTVE